MVGIVDLVNELPPGLARPLSMRIRGYTSRDIALEFHITEDSAKVAVCRGLRELRERHPDMEINAKSLARMWHEHQTQDALRLKAIAINDWLKQHGKSLRAAAREDMQRIMAEMVNGSSK